jgi:DNA invertase Pin-like site-specific DNA recombinase
VIRAAVYARISSDRDGDQLGVMRQVEDCERLCLGRRWEVAERYVDDHVSAYLSRARPAYRRMLDDIQGGFLDAVVVWHLDRLHRQPRELEEFFQVCEEAGVSRLASVSGDIDLATHDGQFLARILGAVSRKESDDKSRRIRRKHEELALAGKIAGGGTRPFGFEQDRRTIREDEAVVIRESAERLLAGEAVRSICRDLEARGVPTVTGRPWVPQTLTRMLMSGRISGQREHRGELVAEAEWPGIITKEETARIRALLSDPNRRTNRSARRYLLVRLLRCGLCGELLVSRPRSGGARRYICARGPGHTGCGHMYVLADPVEAFVVEAVLHRLDSPELACALDGGNGDPDAERWQSEVEQSQVQLDELATLYGEREITLSEWRSARTPIEQRVTDAKKQLAKLSRTTALAGHVGNSGRLRERWSDLPLTRQHSIVAAVLDHIIVKPGRPGFNGFDPGRFSPIWRA